MFPYPSGFLHMGHVRVYSISDCVARYHRLAGKNVLHPMGWDAFGLPAENAALERGLDPEEWTQKNIANMKSIMEEMNFSFDWNREFATCDSDYYKWTQFFFLKLFEAGLVYRKLAYVNWDPVDKTVLADEQVDIKGCSWRSGAVVEKKLLQQWFVKTTFYAKNLSDGLKDPELEDWKDVINIQDHWIGEVNGTTIDFETVGVKDHKVMPIWMNHIEHIDKVKFVAVRKGSIWAYGHNDEGLLPYSVKNPFTENLLPVYLTNSVLFPDKRDVTLGIPAINEADKKFADSFKIPYSEEPLPLISEEELIQFREKLCAEARDRGIGGYPTSSKLNDWLISRQRYWGTPIPIIHCEKCGEQPVPEKDLPVRLPGIKKIKKGLNSLKEVKDWVNTLCPKCGGKATRETDTLDTFVDSSWYYLRYLDPDNEDAAFDFKKVKKLMPVDIYVGGKEHATLHLYYARFMNHFLHSVGLVPQREPFRRLLCQGMVKGLTYTSVKTGEYINSDFVEIQNGKPCHKETKEPLSQMWEKMSKSKHNSVNPKDLLKKYGVDTMRLFILSGPNPRSDFEWDETRLREILIWQSRMWLVVSNFLQLRNSAPKKYEQTEDYKKADFIVYDSRNFFLKAITHYIENYFDLATAIVRLRSLTKTLKKCNEDIIVNSLNYEKALATQIILLAPMAPYFASELWAGFNKAPNRLCHSGEILWDRSVFEQPLPKVDEEYVAKSEKAMSLLNITQKLSKQQKAEKKRKKKEERLKSEQKSLEIADESVEEEDRRKAKDTEEKINGASNRS